MPPCRDAQSLAVSVGSLVFYFVAGALPLPLRVPRSIFLIEWVLSGYLTAGVWIAYRTSFEPPTMRWSCVSR